MRPVKLFALVLLFPAFLVTAFFVRLATSFLGLQRSRIASELIKNFTFILRVLLNVRIAVEGAKDLGTRSYFIVSNHLGYLDGIVLGSIFPVIFVTKRSVKRWPVIGQLLAVLGTVFFDREDKKDIVRVVDEISKTLTQGVNVLLFPEGTSTNGEEILPFQPGLFAAPIIGRSAVVPITLTYQCIDREPVSPSNRDRIYWYGDMSFAPHLWDLLGTHRIEVSVKIHPLIETADLQNSSQCRKQLSQACYDIISQAEPAKAEKSPAAVQLFPQVLRRQPS
jgi:1-acyl-sn-glycerol-3-phosphate acyltransferase